MSTTLNFDRLWRGFSISVHLWSISFDSIFKNLYLVISYDAFDECVCRVLTRMTQIFVHFTIVANRKSLDFKFTNLTLGKQRVESQLTFDLKFFK